MSRARTLVAAAVTTALGSCVLTVLVLTLLESVT